MSRFRTVVDHYHRKGWDETWEYPSSGSLITFETQFPRLAPLYFSWETAYEPTSVMGFSRRNYWLGPFFTALYVAFVFIGPRLMANRKPLNLRRALQCWNLLLAVFSTWGMIRVVPHLLLCITRVGFLSTLCVPPVWSYGSGSAGLWTMLFIYSKFFELIDTVFIVLRKRPISFLHWYHHATVLLYTWDAFIMEQPPGIYFCAMNYTVHAVMYFYYYLSAATGKQPKWGVAVTTLQIAQMIIGVAVTCISMKLSFTYDFIPFTTAENAFKPFEIPGCYLSRGNLLGCMFMYSTYFYLFAQFFWSRYVGRQQQIKEKTG